MTYTLTTPLYYVNDKPHLGSAEHTLRRQSLHQQVISSGGISRQAPSRRQAQRNRRVPRPLLPPSIKSLPSS